MQNTAARRIRHVPKMRIQGVRVAMPLLGFTVFKDKILNGEKTQTIRKLRKKPIMLGDKLYLYWHLRQKDCEKLGETICIEEYKIQIHSEYYLGKQRPLVLSFTNIGYWRTLDPDEVAELVRRDGFETEDTFLEWFTTHYGSGETFQVIRWPDLWEKGEGGLA